MTLTFCLIDISMLVVIHDINNSTIERERETEWCRRREEKSVKRQYPLLRRHLLTTFIAFLVSELIHQSTPSEIRTCVFSSHST